LGHIGTSIVSDGVEAPMTECGHELGEIGCHGSLARLRVVRSVRQRRGFTISAKVGTNDREPGLHQCWSHAMPRGMRPWMSVDQQHSRTGTPVTHTKSHIANVDMRELKTFEHQVGSSRRACWCLTHTWGDVADEYAALFIHREPSSGRLFGPMVRGYRVIALDGRSRCIILAQIK
jgi:hypothetical protein